MTNRLFLFTAIIALAFSSCKKDEYILVPDNEPPPDGTISTLTKETYANKVYISLLGRKPEPAEMDDAVSILSKNNLSEDNRHELLDGILESDMYFDRMYDVYRGEILNQLDTSEITNQIYVFQFLLTDTAYQSVWDLLQEEIIRLQSLKDIPKHLKNGSLDAKGMFIRLIDNPFYDDINMGSENFVVSAFQHFFFRYPIAAELENGVLMVEGFQSVVLNQSGNSKEDFITALFNSDDYYEGRARDLYNRYLFRDPTTLENDEHSTLYKTSDNYSELQKAILSLDEYVGIK